MRNLTISNSDDTIDSLDIIDRIEELEAMLADTPDDFGEDEAAELAALSKLAEEAEGYAPDWKYGEVLIRDSYFKRYAEELAEDIGAVNRDASWPNNHIDWVSAAADLRMDYTAVDFDGVTYWVRVG